ncbi:MAG: hypothetical protein ABEL97_08575 [Salinibacter sp.]
MAVVGSTIQVDLHLTEDADMDTVRGVVRQNGARVHSDLAQRLRQTVEERARSTLDGHGVEDYDLGVNVDLVADRVPGAPRERVTVTLDFEGDDGVVAAIDDAVSPPDRARLADALEETTQNYLHQYDLRGAVEVTVSVTPIQFR